MRAVLTSCATLGVVLLAGCASSTAPAERPDENSFQAIRVGMTKEEVLGRLGNPDPKTRRESIWDYELGGPQDPVYRVIFDGDRVVKVKRFDGYAVVDDSGPVPHATLTPR